MNNGNIQRPNMKWVYENGTDRTPTHMSAIAKFIRHLRKTGSKPLLNSCTKITNKFSQSAKIETNEYKIMKNICHSMSRASSLSITSGWLKFFWSTKYPSILITIQKITYSEYKTYGIEIKFLTRITQNCRNNKFLNMFEVHYLSGWI